ncbi:MAG: GYD domain-containing protein [Actinomycetota bacterium]
MAHFLYLGSYTQEGRKGLVAEGGSKRREAVEGLARSVGGKLVYFSFAIGEHDLVAIIDVPDTAAALVAPLIVGSLGIANITTVSLLDPSTLDDVAARIKNTTYRAPGAN